MTDRHDLRRLKPCQKISLNKLFAHDKRRLTFLCASPATTRASRQNDEVSQAPAPLGAGLHRAHPRRPDLFHLPVETRDRSDSQPAVERRKHKMSIDLRMKPYATMFEKERPESRIIDELCFPDPDKLFGYLG